MADMLATTADLRDLLGEDTTTLPDAQAALLLQMATAEVQAAAGQLLVLVSGDVADIMGTTESWLVLPQRPVTDVATVELDGEPVTDWKRFGSRLFRSSGWSAYVHEPSQVTVTYSHGYAPDDPGLELARSLALTLAAALFRNPDGLTAGVSVDDYREQMVQSTADSGANRLPKASRDLLRRTYGVRAGLVKVG